MKTQPLTLIILAALILVSCSPMATPLPPTETNAPTPTASPTTTPLPVVTATPVPTSAPEKLTDAKDLAAWIDEFVHAYGGKVTVNGTEMTASQLMDAILANPDPFMQPRQINGKEYLFLVVNDIPLAMRSADKWEEATMARLSELTGAVFEFGRSGPQDHVYESRYSQVLAKVAGEGSSFVFPSEMDTCRIFNTFTDSDWQKIITNWDAIEKELDQGKIPEGYPYEWQGVYKIINYARQHIKNPQFRAQHLVELRMPPSYCLLANQSFAPNKG